MKMIDNTAINLHLKNFEFLGFAQTVAKLLRAYGIVQPTIDKIVSKINQGEAGPFYVYRRAVIYCDGTDKKEEIIENINMGSCPLIIVFRPSNITIINQNKGRIECNYNSLYEYAEYLLPLQNWDITRNDQYSTLELDTLVESLYRSLKLDDNEEIHIRSFIFSLLYVAHFRCLLDIEQILQYLKDGLCDDKNKLSKVLDYFSKDKCPFIVDNTHELLISKESYKYIFAIIRFDTTLVDSEVLTSLLYHMADREEAGLYGHNTSYTNVAKVLNSLFLNDYQEIVSDASLNKLSQIIEDVYGIKVFDPTNSPGCYLVAAYNGLVQLLKYIETVYDLKYNKPLLISNFIALVENDLTAELTRLALVFAHTKELKLLNMLDMDALNNMYNDMRIHIGDELQSDWTDYIRINNLSYIVGSPKFQGCNRVPNNRKVQMQKLFKSDVLNNADYCSTWLVKASQLIPKTGAKAAFVLTNSVAQGNQASFVLNKINEFGCEYIFAHRSFKWSTPSNINIGVTVVIIGIAEKNTVETKYVYDNNNKINCQTIGPNLLPNIDIRVQKRSNNTGPISNVLPAMRKGNMPDGATALTFEAEELDAFLEQNPDAKKFIKQLYGGDEFVKSAPRYCLWITDNDLEEAKKIKGVNERIEIVRKTRNSEKSTASDKSKTNPHKFREQNTTSEGRISVIVPCVTSENREYFQMGILDSNAIVNNNVNVIFDCDIWVLALLESRMHMVWAKNAAGGHETRPRYSSEICYNTFPAPYIGKKEIGILRNLSKTLLEVREKYCNRSLGDLYRNMPPELLNVHKWIDQTVDSFYRNQPFETDEERLVWLKNLYIKMTEDE